MTTQTLIDNLQRLVDEWGEDAAATITVADHDGMLHTRAVHKVYYDGYCIQIVDEDSDMA